ncbi:MAG TPA: hypothetical protein VFW50_37315 [Streptosporangiaceae bacterium]|nr:hypothetical protein [Streptosporangiaceae bacterium]
MAARSPVHRARGRPGHRPGRDLLDRRRHRHHPPAGLLPGQQSTVCEQSAGSGQGQAGYLAAAPPGSGLAAARWLDDTARGHVRVYYQDPHNVIREQCYDSGAWVSGQFVVPTR